MAGDLTAIGPARQSHTEGHVPDRTDATPVTAVAAARAGDGRVPDGPPDPRRHRHADGRLGRDRRADRGDPGADGPGPADLGTVLALHREPARGGSRQFGAIGPAGAAVEIG